MLFLAIYSFEFVLYVCLRLVQGANIFGHMDLWYTESHPAAKNQSTEIMHKRDKLPVTARIT